MKNMSSKLLAVLLFAGLLSCKKTDAPTGIPPVDTTHLSDARTILLNQVVLQHLPSPYFKFEYNDSGFVTRLNFAGNFFRYKLEYKENRISKMINEAGVSSLLYNYTGNRVSFIREVNTLTGQSRGYYDFAYNNSQQLKEIRWFSFEPPETDSTMERRVVFKYNADGNLASYDDYRKENNGIVQWARTVSFPEYDNGTNVDDINLVKEFFDPVLFLPQIKFQKNNPVRSIIKGTVNDYEINYSYQYNAAKLPLRRMTQMKATRGTEAGQIKNFTDWFSYY